MITKAALTGGFFVCVQKIVTYRHASVCNYSGMENNDILILTDISEGQKARLTRLAKVLRQIDVASLAKVNTIDVTRLEKDRYVLPTRRKRILAVLGLLEDDNESDD